MIVFHPSSRFRVTSPTPPSCKARHPPPPQQGRWAFIRPARRIIVTLSTLGRWGIRPPFAEASGDEPPRPNHPRKLHFRGARYRGTPPLDEELVTFPLRAEFPSIGGVARSAGVVRECRIGYLLSCHSRARGPRKYECICGVVKAGILYPFSNNFCHSRARGPRKYECICGVDKAGIGLGLLIVI